MMKNLLRYTLMGLASLLITQPVMSQIKMGCLSFDGVDDYIESANTSLNSIGSGDFTIEAWIKGDESLQNEHPIIFSSRTSINNGLVFFFHSKWGGSNSKMLCVRFGGRNHFILNNGTYNGSLLDDNYHHVAITKQATLVSFYVDGVLFGTYTISGSDSVGSNAPLWIGKDPLINSTFEGNIAQVRIWDVARTESEIASDMNTSISGNIPGLISYWEMNEGTGQLVADKIANSNGELGISSAVDANDPTWFEDCSPIEINQPVIAQTKMGCLNFDGADDYIESANTSLNNIGSGDFTVEAWIKGDEFVQNQHPMIFSSRTSIYNGLVFFFHSKWGGSNSKMLCVRFGGRNHFILNNGTYNGSLLDNNYHHVAITKQSTLVSFYADGVLFGTYTISGSASVGSNAPLWIGKDPLINSTFEGNIAQVRIWDLARTEPEIAGDMNTSISGNISGLLSYWEMNEGTGQLVADKIANSNGELGISSAVDANDPTWFEDCSPIDPIIVDTTEIDTTVIDITTNLVENSSSLGGHINIFPNPNNGLFNVDLTRLEGEVDVQVYNLLGEIVYTKENLSGTLKIDIQDHPTGIYFVKFYSGDDQMVKRIIKK